MKIVIKSCPCSDDKEMSVDGEIVLSGDYYHNKISSQIEGFLEALRFLKVGFQLQELGEGSRDCDYGC